MNEVQVSLRGIADYRRLTIAQSGVAGLMDCGDTAASRGFLDAGVSGSRPVHVADIGAVKADGGKVFSTTTVECDRNADDSITQADVPAVKARSGLVSNCRAEQPPKSILPFLD